MSDRVRCHCQRCTIRGLMGPAILVTLGVLFLLDQMRGGYFSFGNTFPIILIVIGVISLASTLAPTNGHINGQASSVPPGSAPPSPQNPYAGPGQAQGR
jgi:cell wall-active antibiotic response 4TMS protein YvqF